MEFQKKGGIVLVLYFDFITLLIYSKFQHVQTKKTRIAILILISNTKMNFPTKSFTNIYFGKLH